MEFTYQDFLDNYATEESWLPKGPLEPWKCIDQRVFPSDDASVEKLLEDTKNAFTRRLGGTYYEKYDRAGGTDGSKCLRTDITSDDDSIHDVIELLGYVS